MDGPRHRELVRVSNTREVGFELTDWCLFPRTTLNECLLEMVEEGHILDYEINPHPHWEPNRARVVFEVTISTEAPFIEDAELRADMVFHSLNRSARKYSETGKL